MTAQAEYEKRKKADMDRVKKSKHKFGAIHLGKNPGKIFRVECTLVKRRSKFTIKRKTGQDR
jgi:hypothetical protein